MGPGCRLQRRASDQAREDSQLLINLVSMIQPRSQLLINMILQWKLTNWSKDLWQLKRRQCNGNWWKSFYKTSGKISTGMKTVQWKMMLKTCVGGIVRTWPSCRPQAVRAVTNAQRSEMETDQNIAESKLRLKLLLVHKNVHLTKVWLTVGWFSFLNYLTFINWFSIFLFHQSFTWQKCNWQWDGFHLFII